MARSRSRSRREVGLNGLPLPSTLRRSDIGKVMEDRQGNLKQVSSKLTWVNAQVRDLSRAKSDQYFKKIDRYLDDENAIRDILIDVLEDCQPKVSRSL